MQLMHGLSAKLRRSLNLNNSNGDTEMRPAQSEIEILVLTNVRSTSRSQSWLNTSPALVIGSNTFFYARTRTNLHAGIAGSDNRNYRRQLAGSTLYGVSNLMSAFGGKADMTIGTVRFRGRYWG
jgi:hypothetical protein